MKLSSCAFENNGMIPKCHTGFGEDRSPQLEPADLPRRTLSVAVIMKDMDIPLIGPLTHWLIWNIEPVAVIPEGLPHGKTLAAPIRAVQGNAWGKHCYRGPKQPPFVHREHRYRFTAYALDCELAISGDSGPKAVRKAMEGHVLEKAELYGRYAPEA